MSEPVLIERRDAVTIVSLNRPRHANALNAAARDGIRQAFTDFEADEHAQVAVLTALGDRTFCAGADLKEMAEVGLENPRDFIPPIDRITAKPVIAAVNGAALAGGFLLAQSCDLCIAAEEASFAITEARWGRGAPWAVPLAEMVPRRIMMEILLTAQPISAARAYDVGLVNRVVPRADLLETAVAIAEQIAQLAPLTTRAHRKLVYLAAERGTSSALDAAYELFEHVYTSEDAAEGPRAFTEKRPPVWKGR